MIRNASALVDLNDIGEIARDDSSIDGSSNLIDVRVGCNNVSIDAARESDFSVGNVVYDQSCNLERLTSKHDISDCCDDVICINVTSNKTVRSDHAEIRRVDSKEVVALRRRLTSDDRVAELSDDKSILLTSRERSRELSVVRLDFIELRIQTSTRFSER